MKKCIGNGKNGKKDEWSVKKHRSALAGTGFEDCALCAGCTPKDVIDDDGNFTGVEMRCSRAGKRPVSVTVLQAQSCDGSRPCILNVPIVEPHQEARCSA